MQCRSRSATQRCQHNFQMHIKHSRICCSSVAILICLLASGIAKTNAVPTDSAGGAVARGLRTLRDVSAVAGSAAGLLQEEPKDAASTETAADQPQGQCLLDGVLVAETSVSCEKQVGCRAIQKTGHCCPDYKCDCEKDGKTYLNGDKLVDPETPCTVCYCQGGEILCSSVTCFIRDDCKPKYIAGRCCPAYDNCPVSIFDNNNGGANTTLLQPLVPAPAPAPAPALPVELLNPKITIKEITKPIEIRITDDNKAIPIHQMLKPSSTSTAAPASSTTAAPVPSPSPAPTTTTATAPALASTTTGVDEFAFGESSPATTVVNPDSNRKAPPLPVGGINTESLKLTASVAYANQVFDRRIPSPAQPAAESLSKSDASVEDSAEAPQSGNPADGPISVFGPQGLQHVDSDTAGDPSKVNIKRENLAALEVVPGANTPSGDSSDFGSSEVIYAQPGTVAAEQSGSLQQAVVDLEPDTAGSDNIYHIILTTAGPRVDPSTDGFPPFRSSTEGIDDASVPANSKAADRVTMGLLPSPLPQSTTNAPNILDNSTSARTDSTPAVPSTTQGSVAAPEPSTTDNAQTASSTEANKPSTDGAHHLEEEEAAMPLEANPAYPSLPEDDFSLRDVNFPLSETDDAVEPEIKDEPRSIGGAYDVAKSTKHLLNHSAGFGSLEGSGSGSGAGMLTESDVSAHIAASRPTEGAPGNIALLLNSAEDLSAETTITNSSDFQLKNIMKEAENETGSGDSLESQSLEALISSESGSGELAAAEIAPKSSKQREPTTPRPTRRTEADLDIDELDNSSGDGKAEPLEDPKLDAESLKLDDSQEDGVVQQDAAGQSDVLTVKTHAAQEQAVAEEEAAHVGVDGPRLLLQRYI